MKQNLQKNILWNIFACFVAIIFLAPLYIAFTNSFKTPKGIYMNVISIPSKDMFTLGNYIQAFRDLEFFHSFMNSFLITTSSTLLIVTFASMAAWMLVRSKTKLSKFLFFLFAIAMLIPFQAVMLPLINLMGKLHLLNPVGIVLMYLGFGSSLSIIMYHGFIKNIPIELEEAATIDGCNKLQIFWLIVFPLLKPITVTISILNAMWIWNDFLLPQLVINKPGWQTLPLKMFYFFGEYSKQWNLALAGLVLAMIPIIIFYIFAQKHIVKGITQGSIK
ncbi:carbohydrate ABC transporter permease [Clostridium sp. OS1-26]|uniref:carbohydrate ABC transporter permease n=1 Tax=Clostridium sp. OS1-26 TaxID=3070681 RepID=UPI0027DEEBCA|nr:carbohydrate ABC transporter permease [Clostridium sp. OS1-26]WML34898.1 carbohydrate ABC transporter permease [Clostridium sp. OS1-26]